MGNVVSAGLGQTVARQASIAGGLPVTVGATTVNKVCGASLKAAMIATQAIRSDDGELFVCGGVESMSRAPFLEHGDAGAHAAERPLPRIRGVIVFTAHLQAVPAAGTGRLDLGDRLDLCR